MVIRADILITSVFHTKAAWNRTQLNEAKALIQMSRVYIAFDNSIKLQHTKAKLPAHTQAIEHQFLSDVLSSCIRCNSIACIADMSASAHIVGMEDVQSQNFPFSSATPV